MKPLHAIGSLTVASIIMFAAGAKAANYSFINAAGGSAADSANWQNSSVPADSETTASVAFTNLTQGSTATLADTPHEWKELLVANGTIAGGSIALTDGIKASAKGGETTVESKLSGTEVAYVHGAKVRLGASQTDDVAVGVRNGTLVLDGTLTSGSTLHLDGNGVIEVAGNQTVATLEGDCKGGRLQIDGGKTLTLEGGDDAAETVFCGSLFGSGNLVKNGSDYELTLAGDNTTNHPFSGSIDINEGKLALTDGKSRTYAVTPTMYWSFDNPGNPGKADVGTADFKTCAWDSSSGHVTSSADISAAGVSGYGIHPDGTVFVGSNQGSAPRGNAAFSVLCWAKADPANGGRVQLLGWGDRTMDKTQFALTLEASGGVGVFNSYLINSNYRVLLAGPETDLKDGKWHCIAATFDGAMLKVYIDGESAGSAETAFNMKDGWSYLDLGISSAGNAGERTVCDVTLDEVAVYAGTALSATQIGKCFASFGAVPETMSATATLPDPVAWYRFDDASNVGKDSSGNGYDLSVVDKNSSGTKPSNATAPVVKDGSPIHGGMYYSTHYGYLRWGGGSGGTLPAKMPKGSGTPVTVSLWVNASGSSPIVGSTSYNATMFQLGTGSNSQRIGIRYGDGYRRFTMLFGNNTGWNLSSGSTYGNDCFVNAEPLDVTGWHHVAYSFDGSMYSFYVDGQLQGTGTKSVTIADNGNLFLGVDEGALSKNSKLFAGYMDEVKIYDTALTAAQVMTDYRRELPRTGNVIDSSAVLTVASGATLCVDGAEQTFESVPAGTGVIQLKHNAALALDPASDAVLSSTVNGCGAVSVEGNRTLTVAGEIGPGVSVVLGEDASLAIADGGAINGNLEVGEGAVLKMGTQLTVGGTVTLKPGFVIDASSAAASGWTALISAKAIVADGVDLADVSFVNGSASKGVVRVNGGKLEAKLKMSFVIVVR